MACFPSLCVTIHDPCHITAPSCHHTLAMQGIMNYVILRPITTTIALITDIFGLYGQGRVDFGKSYVYLTATTNFSQVSLLSGRAFSF